MLTDVERIVARTLRRDTLLPAVMSIAIGCGSPDDRTFVEAVSQHVVGGELSSESRDAVVFLRAELADGRWKECSGTLVSPRVVVTAKHCLWHIEPGPFLCEEAGERLDDGSRAGLFGAAFDPELVSVFVGVEARPVRAARGVHAFAPDSHHACRDDIALLTLDVDVDAPSYPAIRRFSGGRAGARVTVVGYGSSDHHGSIVRRESSGIRVVGGTGDSLRDHAPPRSLITGGSGACFGDSGGPALSEPDGALLGVCSRITGPCDAPESRQTYTLVAAFPELFARAFAAVGSSGTVEPAPAPDATDDRGGMPTGKLGAPSRPAEAHVHDEFACSTTRRRRGSAALWTLALLGAAGLLRYPSGRSSRRLRGRATP